MRDSGHRPLADLAGGFDADAPELRRVATWVWLWLALAFPGWSVLAQPASPTAEYRVKAVFLLNFTKFTEWPASSFSGPVEPLVVGVLGSEPVAQALEEALHGEAINGHPLMVRRLNREESWKGCQVLFISRGENERVAALLATLKEAPVLTVGEVERFCQRGGTINFYLQDDRVKFEANPDQATRAGLRISSKMLSLARITKTEN
jgi:YfiR/HmsC-like